jgi:ABC-type lipoprotein export system ATPase subunit
MTPDIFTKSEEPYVICRNLVKIYQVAGIEVFALQGLDMVIKKRELMAIIGASGSGKSTLLNILGGLDVPTGGKASVGKWNLDKLGSYESRKYKRQVVGFVWQNIARNLVPYLTALENVKLPMILNGTLDNRWAEELLKAVGLEDRMNHRSLELSGGQQQRVAIAIAIANKPELLLADEPTGSLDHASGRTVLDVFSKVRDLYGITVIIVTHDMLLARSVDRYLRIRDGKITSEAVRKKVFHEEKAESELHDEFILLDSAGRMQIPEEYLGMLNIKNKVKIHVEDKKIIILPPDE